MLLFTLRLLSPLEVQVVDKLLELVHRDLPEDFAIEDQGDVAGGGGLIDVFGGLAFSWSQVLRIIAQDNNGISQRWIFLFPGFAHQVDRDHSVLGDQFLDVMETLFRTRTTAETFWKVKGIFTEGNWLELWLVLMVRYLSMNHLVSRNPLLPPIKFSIVILHPREGVDVKRQGVQNSTFLTTLSSVPDSLMILR